jgi:hypothetical protein
MELKYWRWFIICLFLTSALATLAQIVLFLEILKFSIPPFFKEHYFFMKEKENYFWNIFEYFIFHIKISKLANYSTNMC